MALSAGTGLKEARHRKHGVARVTPITYRRDACHVIDMTPVTYGRDACHVQGRLADATLPTEAHNIPAVHLATATNPLTQHRLDRLLGRQYDIVLIKTCFKSIYHL